MSALVQVAGIIDEAEAQMLCEAGVDWLGFPLRLPSGKDDITEYDAAKAIAGLPAPHQGVLISYLTDAAEVAGFCRELGVRAVQLHGDVEDEQLRILKDIAPELYVLKSLVVRTDNAKELLAQVDRTADVVDMFITDTFDPRTGAKGATGLLHDWSVSAELVARSPKPLMMAGGLSPDNVADAIRQVRPAAVDAHSLLEGADGRKDAVKVRDFVTRARDAFAEIN
ncbi:phosphoribosylanthranilate isomerase [Rhodococcus sp. SBT000017]|uniref:phosphoribosylanthranilate isomerase n=1 Tax=unclassified Rhodococcus (in: high G+C Gram-positive bacteria) TaxID=192944 RepID=UPI000B0BF045|nr:MULTISPECIES: phosphoribosylanthranilate isomerase [unclassified Rhodococcus (in: high G+C Gram-positive bacteria)]RMB77699.1 phosphoribosylanthranilate isomerase [Rhodococcus sp. SBT000017]